MILARLAWLALPCLSLSAIALGRALQILDGFYHPAALNWVLFAFGLAAAGVLLLPASAAGSRRGRQMLIAVLAGGIFVQIVMLLGSSPGRTVSASANLGLFRAGILLEAGLVALAFLEHAQVRRLWFPALLAVHALVGTWLVLATPDPGIDVIVVHREAITALLADQDPYRISFENIYGGDSGTYYNPRAVVGNRVAFGYPYPPLSLFLAVPGQFLAGDYRYAELAALLLGAGLIGYMRPSLHARLAAALLLTTPRGLFVIEQGWTEPIGVLMTALVAFFMVRRPAVVPWVGGLLAVTKQYLLPRRAADVEVRVVPWVARRAGVCGESDSCRGRRHAAAGPLASEPVPRGRHLSTDAGALSAGLPEPVELGILSGLGFGLVSLGGGRSQPRHDRGVVARPEHCGRIRCVPRPVVIRDVHLRVESLL